MLNDVSFEMRAGEIVGVTGLLGSGRTELALALFGMFPADTGQIAMDGQPVKIRSIQDAIAPRHRLCARRSAHRGALSGAVHRQQRGRAHHRPAARRAWA